jgi:adenosyl cobinamide kinase/adenosyl cobinamide phosphate guanylyltransferase
MWVDLEGRIVMRLIIGGHAQGKLTYVINKYNVEKDKIWDSQLPQNTEKLEGTIVINHLNNWIKSQIKNNGNPEEEITNFINNYPDCIIISDEVGNGIVPIDKFEREYRERTGRIQIELAKQATEVERIICGISQKIK